MDEGDWGQGGSGEQMVVVCFTLGGQGEGVGMGEGTCSVLPLYLHGPCLHEAWRRWDRPSC